MRSFGWKDIAVFALVLIVFNFVAGWQAKRGANDLRDDINRFAAAECYKAQATGVVDIYNGLVDVLVDDYEARRDENVSRGDTEKAAINRATITGLKNSRIPNPSVDCSKPILK